MMYLIITYCNKILIKYMTGHPLITCFFNAQQFHYITFSSKESSCLSNMYINPELNIINPLVGRPRWTWLESVEADIAELEINKENVHDRKKWRENVMKRKSNPIGKWTINR